MASLKYHKDVKRWRVFWHVTMSDRTLDKGSRSFKTKAEGKRFKEHCEKKGKLLKRAKFADQVLLTDALDEWTAHLQRHTDRTQGLYELSMKLFIEFLPDNAVYITDLTKQDINSCLNYLMSKGLKNKTVNNYMTVIKSFCSFIHENYGIENPAVGIKKLKEDPPNVRFLTKEEYQKILQNCDDFARPWIQFIANTGLRATEFCNLKWENYDAKAKTITVVGKGRKRRTVGLNKIAVEVLKERKKGRKVGGSEPVFLQRNGKPVNRDRLHYQVSKTCCDSGIYGGPHALRHFFAEV